MMRVYIHFIGGLLPSLNISFLYFDDDFVKETIVNRSPTDLTLFVADYQLFVGFLVGLPK